MKELFGLTGLRFLAAFYVFVFHMWMHFSFAFLPAPLVNIISQGAIGVNVFFVLSGFIMLYTHLKDYPTATLPDRQYYQQFMLKRFARIYPAYLVGLLFFLAISVAFASYPENFTLVAALDASMLQSYIPFLSMQWYGGGGWSISTEFFFYILFPVALPLLLRIQRKQTLLALLALLVLLSSGPGLAQILWPEAVYFPTNYSFPPARLPEFLCGVLLGLLMLRHSVQISEAITIGLLLVTGLYLAKYGSRFFGFTHHNWIVVPTTMAVIGLLAQAERTSFFNWVGSEFMQYLGRISFSFYIMQLPLLFLLTQLLDRQIIHKEDSYVVGIVFVVNLALAAGLHEFVEKRAHRFILSRFGSRKQATSPVTAG